MGVDNSKNKSTHGGARDGAGRPAGSQNKATIDEKIAKEEMRQRVLANLEPLLTAQLSLAKGISHVFRVDIGSRGGRSDPSLVTNPDELHEAIDLIAAGDGFGEIVDEAGDDENFTRRYYFITTKAPDNKALDSLLDRVFGRAAQPVEHSGELNIIDDETQAKANRAIAAVLPEGDPE